MLRVIVDFADLITAGLLPRHQAIAASWPRRAFISLAAFFLLLPLLVYYWLGLIGDEVFFRRYRRVEVKKPVFILGVPRSGTTALHEALSADQQFTTTRTWECLLAPAISHRYLWRGIARADRRLGAPLRQLAGWINRRWLAPLTNAHPLQLQAPEEDYLTLLPQLSAFILIIASPENHRLWRLGRGDLALQASERKRLMRHYHRSIQRHLYFHGTDRRYLAKNASFATLAGSLLNRFPDARIIACLREPEQVVSSQLSSLLPTLRTLYGPINQTVFNERMLRQLHFAYQNLLQKLPQTAAEQAVFLPLNAQRQGLGEAIETTYQALDIPLSAQFKQCLQTLAERARSHQSGHRHKLSDHDLSEVTVKNRFADIHAGFDFTQTKPQPARAMKPLQPARTVVVVCDAQLQRNGVGTYYADLVDHLRSRNNAIHVVAPGHTASPIRHWLEMKMPGDASQRVCLPSPIALYRHLQALDPDVMILAAPGPYAIMASAMAGKLGSRRILGLHTDFEALSSLYYGRWLGPINRYFMRGINHFLFKRSDAVVSNSEHMQQIAQGKGAGRAVKVKTPLPRALLETPLQPLNTPPERVLFVGRLATEKRVHTVIDAASKHPTIAFAIAGDGPERSMVESAAQTHANLNYLGWVARERLPEILNETDLLVLPSEVEAFGTVALEAMARGRLVLVSAGCGIADWAVFKPCLEVMYPGETTAEAITRLLQQPPAALAEKARLGRMQAEATARECIDEWQALMETL